MALLDIIIYPDPRLREKCIPVSEITDETRRLLDDMAETMYHAPGIGLAASQVGSLYRAIVVDIGEDEETGRKGRLYKIINPVILQEEGSTETEEGCLSIPKIRDVVSRFSRVVVEGLDESGKPLSIDATDLLAICLQHEIDHLNGILFIDRLSHLKRELIKSKLKKLSV